MNKSEQRELAKAQQYKALFDKTKDAAILSIVARTMGTLVRSARTNKAARELMDAADSLGVSGHTDYITARF